MMQNAEVQRNKDYRGGDRGDRDRGDRDRVDKDGFRSFLPRPDINTQKRDIAAHEKEIAACNKELGEIKIKQDKIRNDRNGGRQEFENAKRAMSKLMETKKRLHAQKSDIEARRDASHKKIMSGQDKEKAAKGEMKFSSIDAIDKKIKELELKQARTSMSLTEEKNLVKEIKTLNLSKKDFAALQELKALTDRERALKAGIDKEYADKNAELKVLYKELDAQKIVLDTLNKASNEGSKQVPAFKLRTDELRAKIEAENAAMKALREEIASKEAALATAVAEEKLKWRAEQAELKSKLEAEELARHPYEEEVFVCNFLLTYLTSKCAISSSEEASAPPSSSSSSSSSSAADTPSAFAGMKSLKRDEDEAFMGGAAKKKSKKKGGQNSKDDITHTHESLEHFSSVGVKAPLKVSSLADSIKELHEKKEYFNNLERGAIPSLKTLRAKQASGATSKAGTGAGGKKKAAGGVGGNKSVFNMESTAEYPGLL